MVRHFTLKNPGPSLTPEDIDTFEREIGGRLPDDYKEFMLVHNGGFPEPLMGLLWHGKIENLRWFVELTPPTSTYGLRQSLRHLRELNPASTKGFVPIASLGEGYICMDVRGRVGAVFRTEYKYNRVYKSDLVPVDVTMAPLAGSFNEFLKNLTEIPDPYCRIEDLGKRGTPEDLDRYLAEGNSIQAVGEHRMTLICEAVGLNNLPMIQACIKRGASLSGTMKAAVEARRTHLIEILIKAGADVNERDDYGKTPLYYVLGTALPGEEGARNRELYDLLVKFGAVGGQQ